MVFYHMPLGVYKLICTALIGTILFKLNLVPLFCYITIYQTPQENFMVRMLSTFSVRRKTCFDFTICNITCLLIFAANPDPGHHSTQRVSLTFVVIPTIIVFLASMIVFVYIWKRKVVHNQGNKFYILHFGLHTNLNAYI